MAKVAKVLVLVGTATWSVLVHPRTPGRFPRSYQRCGECGPYLCTPGPWDVAVMCGPYLCTPGPWDVTSLYLCTASVQSNGGVACSTVARDSNPVGTVTTAMELCDRVC